MARLCAALDLRLQGCGLTISRETSAMQSDLAYAHRPGILQ